MSLRSALVASAVLLLAMAIVWPAAAREQQVLTGDMVRVMGDVHVAEDFRVRGNAVAVFGNVKVEGEVDSDVVAVFGTVAIGPNAVVGGNTVAVFGRLDMDPGARVRGSTVSVFGDGRWEFGSINLPSMGQLARFDMARRIPSLLFALAASALVLLLFPDAVRRVRKGIADEPGVSALAGLGSLILAAPVIVVSAMTLVGIPLALAIGMGLWAGRLLGYTAITLMIGERIIGPRDAPRAGLGAVVVGVIVLAIFAAVPFAGLFVSLGVTLVAVGGAILTRFGSRRQVA